MTDKDDEYHAAIGFAILCGGGCVAVGMWLLYEIWRFPK